MMMSYDVFPPKISNIILRAMREIMTMILGGILAPNQTWAKFFGFNQHKYYIILALDS